MNKSTTICCPTQEIQVPRAKLPPTSYASVDDVEQSFYEALQEGNLDKLMACWADEDDVLCIHPGGPRLVGLATIREAFEQLFSHGHINVTPERVRRVQTPHAAVHSVLERIGVLTQDGPREAYVMATNVYMQSAMGWRLVAHHASPGAASELQEITARPSVLH
jgi:ketosteroid isomerase-like protein